MKESPENPNELEPEMDQQQSTEQEAQDPEVNVPVTPFFHVSIKKFAVMFVMTLGFYSVYWFFKQWQALKEYYQLDAWPIARAVFSIFFTHSLFRYVREYIIESGRECQWQGGNLASVYVILVIGSSIIGQVFDKLSQNVLLGLVAIVLTMCSVYPLYKAQEWINYALEDLDYQVNDKFTFSNWIWIVIGSTYWFFVGRGALMAF